MEVAESSSEQDVTTFSDGSITKIKFNNFLTYSHMEIVPGPYLNVITGPNGTGKSTIICGLCLALGGNPKVLGRSENMSDYIRYGCEQASVVVFVRDSKFATDRKISVVLHSLGAAEYFYDDRKITRKELGEIVANYNIQVDNPCTFLAQDKVKSFAEQDPCTLLINTEKALEPKLVRLHEAVKDLELQSEARNKKLKELEKRMNEIQNELRTLTPIVENYRHRETMLERIRLLEKKQLYMECWAAIKLVEQNNQFLEEKQEELSKTKVSMIPTEKKLEEQRKITVERKQYARQAISELRSLRDKVEKLLGVESVNDLLLCARKEYEQKKKEYNVWEENLNAARTEHSHLKEKLVNADQELKLLETENSVLRKEYEEWNAKEEDLDRRKSTINNALAEIDSNKRYLNEMINAEQQFFGKKFIVMEGAVKEMKCGDAWQWYESHKKQFRHPVYVPLLFITLLTDDASKYLENIIARRDFLMFIFRCKEDEMLLTDKRHPWKINTCVLNDAEIANFSKGQTVSETLRSYGFNCMASDLYTAPDPVKAYLNSVSSLHKIPIGSLETEKRLDEVCEALKNSHRLFLTNSSRIQVSISRYSGNLSVRAETLRTSLRFLVAHTAPRKSITNSPETLAKQLDDLRERSNELQTTRDCLGKEEKAIAQGREACRKKMDAFIKKKDARNIIAQQLRLKTARLEALENDKPDLHDAAEVLNKTTRMIIEDTLKRVEEIVGCMEKSKSLIQDAYFATLEMNASDETLESLEGRMERFKEEYERKLVEVKHMEEAVKVANLKIKACTERFREATGIDSVLVKELSKKGKAALKILETNFEENKVPDDFEALQLELAREQGKLEVFRTEGEKKDIERFEKLKQNEECISKELAIAKNYVDDWENRLDQALEQWLTPLENAVGRINHHFSAFFEKLGCAGEVHLQRPDNKLCVSEYGIVIAASFREGERLRQLTHQIQSGGERSVSTMLYILALQELTTVPFRCIDEINQGMDSTNERLVFDMIVEMLSSSVGPAKTQYFLLTPKLLPDLRYSPKVKIHCIYSGLKLAQHDDWDVAQFLGKMRIRHNTMLTIR